MESKWSCGLVLALVLMPSGWGQVKPITHWPNPPAGSQHTPVPTASKADPELQAKAAAQLKLQTQEDTARLHQLVVELENDLAKATAGTMSLDAVKKTNEIEKLAKRLHKELQGN